MHAIFTPPSAWESLLKPFANPDSNLWECLQNATCWIRFGCKKGCKKTCDLYEIDHYPDFGVSKDLGHKLPFTNPVVGSNDPSMREPDMRVLICADADTKGCEGMPTKWTDEMIDALILHALSMRCGCARFEAYYFSSLSGFMWPQVADIDPEHQEPWVELQSADATLRIITVVDQQTHEKRQLWMGKYLWWYPPVWRRNGSVLEMARRGYIGMYKRGPILGGGEIPVNRDGNEVDVESDVSIGGGNAEWFGGAHSVEARRRR